MTKSKNSLKNRLKEILQGKVLILGIGNPLRGDDGSGSCLIRKLEGKVKPDLLDCEDVPENYLGKIKEINPETILIIDAAHLGQEPGSLALIMPKNIETQYYSTTHHPSLKILINYLQKEIGSQIYLLVVQPKTTTFGSPISQEVNTALKKIEEILISILG